MLVAAGLMWHSATLVLSTNAMVPGAAALWMSVAATEQILKSGEGPTRIIICVIIILFYFILKSESGSHSRGSGGIR
jgi:hypothetical protein